MINPKKLLVKNLIMLGLFIICGVLCIIFHKTSSTYVGGICGGIAVIILNLIRNIKFFTNKEYKKQADIDASDERTKMINEKTAEITNFIIMIGCCIGSIVSILLEKNDYLYIFAGIIIIQTISFYIVHLIMNKKY